MPIDPHADRAVYRQLADILRDQILSGQQGPGAKLPGETRLVREYRVGRDTVRQALALLRSEGLVTTVRGAGTRVRVATRREPVPVAPGDRVCARMPVDAERAAFRMAEGVPVLEIHRAHAAVEVHPADRTELRVARSSRAGSARR